MKSKPTLHKTMIQISINGRQITAQKGKSILEVCKEPNPATVQVSVQIEDLVHPQVKGLVVSSITIIDQRTYAGTFNFSLQTGVTASANVTWTMFEDLGDTWRFLPTGTIEADLNIADCDPLHVIRAIKTSTPSVPHETLVVFTSTNAAYPKQHQFVVAADGISPSAAAGLPGNR